MLKKTAIHFVADNWLLNCISSWNVTWKSILDNTVDNILGPIKQKACLMELILNLKKNQK